MLFSHDAGNKLRRMQYHLDEHKRHVGYERSVAQLRICADLLERLRKDEYYEKLSGPLEYKMHLSPVDGRSDMHEFEIEVRKSDGSIQPVEERLRLHRLAEESRRRDLRIAGKILGKYMLEWWD